MIFYHGHRKTNRTTVAEPERRGVTVPAEIRKKLGLKPGDKILFLEQDGRITLVNSSRAAFRELQSELEGRGEQSGLKSEQQVVAAVREVRRVRVFVDTNVLVSALLFRGSRVAECVERFLAQLNYETAPVPENDGLSELPAERGL